MLFVLSYVENVIEQINSPGYILKLDKDDI